MQGLHESLQAVQAIIPAYLSVTTHLSAAIDTKDIDELLVILDGGIASATGTLDVTVTECDTSGGSYAPITGASFARITTANDNTVFVGRIQSKNWKRYIKISAVVGTDVVVAGVVVLLGKADAEKLSQTSTLVFNV
jgi:hypothetical protein